MPVFICEKCGKLDNSANHNNFWSAMGNKSLLKEKRDIMFHYDNSYFETHECCALCCKGLQYHDGSGKNHFNGDEYETVSDKTYKEILSVGQDLSMCYNYQEIIERDKNGQQ